MKRSFKMSILVIFSFMVSFFSFNIIPHRFPLVFRLFICILFVSITIVFILIWIEAYESQKKLLLLKGKTRVIFNLKNLYRKKRFLVKILDTLVALHPFECFAHTEDGVIVLEVKYEDQEDYLTFYFTSPMIFFYYFDIYDSCI